MSNKNALHGKQPTIVNLGKMTQFTMGKIYSFKVYKNFTSFIEKNKSQQNCKNIDIEKII